MVQRYPDNNYRMKTIPISFCIQVSMIEFDRRAVPTARSSLGVLTARVGESELFIAYNVLACRRRLIDSVLLRGYRVLLLNA